MTRLASFVLVLGLLGCGQTVGGSAALPDAAMGVDRPMVANDAGLATDAGSVPVDVGPQSVSDDCRAGTWCWERPRPTGETIADAFVAAAGRVAVVTEGGSLAIYEAGRWRTRYLTLPGRPTSVWMGATSDDVVIGVSEPISQREGWIYELRNGQLTPLAGQGTVDGFQMAGGVLWARGARELYRRVDGRWETVMGPTGRPVLSGLRAVGANEAIVLESWGSGSGTGVLHRYNAGAWAVQRDFREEGYRVEGPLVPDGDAVWMRYYESRSMSAGIVRVVGDQVEDILPPGRLSSIELHSVGDEVWLVSNARAWRRDGTRWIEVDGFPGRMYGAMGGSGRNEAWVFSNGIHRRTNSMWEAVSEPDQATGHFWTRASGEPSLPVFSPAGMLTADTASPALWTRAPLEGLDTLQADSRPIMGVGYVAGEAGAALVTEGVVRRRIPWPSAGRPHLIAGSPAEFWAWSADNVLQAYSIVRQTWQTVEPPRFSDAPNGSYQPLGLHVTDDGAVFAAASVLTGDKQVRNRVFVRDGDGWRQLVAEMGEFGGQQEAHFAGERRDAVWMSVGGLYRFTGTDAPRVAEGLHPHDLFALPDGGVLTVNRAEVAAYRRDGMRTRQLALPPVRGVFHSVHQTPSGVLRIGTASGWVLRHAP